MNFEVISQDADVPVRCSYCTRTIRRVVALPLTDLPGLEDPLRSADGKELWLALCAYCVLDMARALQKAEGAST